MAKSAAPVVVHRSDEDDLLPKPSLFISSPYSRGKQLLQAVSVLNERRNIFRLQPKGGSIPLSQNLRLVLSQISRNEILANKVLLLHLVTVADHKPNRPFQRIQEAIEVRCDMSARSTGAQHNDLHRIYP